VRRQPFFKRNGWRVPNVTVYVSKDRQEDLDYILREDDMGPSELFTRAILREAKRIRKQRERENHQEKVAAS